MDFNGSSWPVSSVNDYESRGKLFSCMLQIIPKDIKSTTLYTWNGIPHCYIRAMLRVLITQNALKSKHYLKKKYRTLQNRLHARHLTDGPRVTSYLVHLNMPNMPNIILNTAQEPIVNHSCTLCHLHRGDLMCKFWSIWIFSKTLSVKITNKR